MYDWYVCSHVLYPMYRYVCKYWYLSIYGIYIPPLQDSYSEVLPNPGSAKEENLEQFIERAGPVS